MNITFQDITQIIVALIGLIGIYYSTRKRTPKIKQKKEAIKPEKGRLKFSKRKYIILFWSSLILLMLNIGILGWRLIPNDSSHIEITYPKNGSKVTIEQDILGESKNIPSNKMIWIIIYSYSAEKFFPNHRPVKMDKNGNWSSHVTIGSSADFGKKFDILAFLIDDSTRNELMAEFNSPEFSGLLKLPTKAILHHRISVTRN